MSIKIFRIWLSLYINTLKPLIDILLHRDVNHELTGARCRCVRIIDAYVIPLEIFCRCCKPGEGGIFEGIWSWNSGNAWGLYHATRNSLEMTRVDGIVLARNASIDHNIDMVQMKLNAIAYIIGLIEFEARYASRLSVDIGSKRYIDSRCCDSLR